MGGLAGFIGTYIIGPRVGLFSQDENLAFILDDQLLDEEGNDTYMEKKADDSGDDKNMDEFVTHVHERQIKERAL